MELIKTQMQVHGDGKGPLTVIREIAQSKPLGIRGLGKGLAMTIFREVPACGVYFSSYEVLVRQVVQIKVCATSSTWSLIGSRSCLNWCLFVTDYKKTIPFGYSAVVDFPECSLGSWRTLRMSSRVGYRQTKLGREPNTKVTPIASDRLFRQRDRECFSEESTPLSSGNRMRLKHNNSSIYDECPTFSPQVLALP